MRIVFVTSRFPYPVEKGDKLRAFHQIRVLSRKHEIHLVAVSHVHVPDSYIDAMSSYCASITVFKIKNWMLPVHLLAGWLEGLPLQVSYFLDRTIKRKVQYHIIHLEPDHVICQLIRAAPYVRALPFPKTLDYMDVFSEGMRQLAGKYKVFGFIFRWEASRLAAFERTIYKDFDQHMIISRQDRDRLKLASHDRIAIIPNGVDSGFGFPYRTHTPTHDLVFVGNMGYGPNIDATRFLVEKLLPEMKARGHVIHLLLAGARPSRYIRHLAGKEGVTVRGWVEDIRDAYADGRIFVAPMFTGLGLQNKILEAMAMGLPCLTTTMVNNAIGAKVGVEILVGDDVNALAGQLEVLLSDPDFARQMADAGRAFVRCEYQWEAQAQKLEACILSPNVYTQT